MQRSSGLRIAIVAGEASGDILGAGLLNALKTYYPDCHIEGIGGSLMEEQGLNSLVPMERLSVMGIFAVLQRLPELLGIRRRLIKRWKSERYRPDIYIGIDSPDFNIGVELALRAHGIPVCHYVSPSVWAWRPKRIFKIKKAVDLMLTLFPFEERYYKEHNIRVSYVGHPLANQIPMQVDQAKARQQLQLGAQKVLAVLPGSRMSEVKMLAPVFLEALSICRKQLPDVQFVLPVYSDKIRHYLTAQLERFPDLSVSIVSQQSQTAMMAADVVLLASGTATLEAMLIKRPMIVAYKISKLTHLLVKNLFSISNFSLPNLLAGKAVVPEFIQENCQPELIAEAVEKQFNTLGEPDETQTLFHQIHEQLRIDASENGARAVHEYLSTLDSPVSQ